MRRHLAVSTLSVLLLSAFLGACGTRGAADTAAKTGNTRRKRTGTNSADRKRQ